MESMPPVSRGPFSSPGRNVKPTSLPFLGGHGEFDAEAGPFARGRRGVTCTPEERISPATLTDAARSGRMAARAGTFSEKTRVTPASGGVPLCPWSRETGVRRVGDPGSMAG